VKYRGSSGKGYSTKKYIIFYIYTSWSGDVSPASVCITLRAYLCTFSFSIILYCNTISLYYCFKCIFL